MTPEAWIALSVGVITILTMVYQAGSIKAEFKTGLLHVCDRMDAHERSDDKRFDKSDEKLDQLNNAVVELKTESGMHLERPKTGGNRHLGRDDVRGHEAT